MKKNLEYHLQKQVCNYLNLQYPDVLYYSTGIGLQLTMLQGVRNKAIQKDGFACPDLLILESKHDYKGLFIELKVVVPYKKDGFLKAGEHLKRQNKSIQELNKKGYYSQFCTGFDEAKKIIDRYLK